MRANESVFGMERILKSDIENFIKYYGVDQLTEHSDTDFDDDGDTVKSPALIQHFDLSSDGGG